LVHAKFEKMASAVERTRTQEDEVLATTPQFFEDRGLGLD
jgi:hypothetical protein